MCACTYITYYIQTIYKKRRHCNLLVKDDSHTYHSHALKYA